jgi:hypothetical protein
MSPVLSVLPNISLLIAQMTTATAEIPAPENIHSLLLQSQLRIFHLIQGLDSRSGGWPYSNPLYQDGPRKADRETQNADPKARVVVSSG